MSACFITKASDLWGRVIAYGGGGSVALFSNQVAAQARAAAEIAAPAIGGPLLPTVISLGGLVVVAGRLVFDIYKYFDQRRRGKIDDESE